MKQALRAAAVLSTGSVLRIFIGLVSAKGWALLVGPSGLGNLSLLESLIGLGTIVFGLGLSTGIVRMLSDARGRGETERVFAFRRAGILATWALGILVIGLCISLRELLSVAVFGTEARAFDIVLIGFGVFFTIQYDYQIGILNAYGRVSVLARVQVVSAAIGAGIALAVIASFGESAIGWAVISGAAVMWVASSYAVRSNIDILPQRIGPVRKAYRDLAVFCIPYTLSSSVSLGMRRALPLILVGLLTVEELGYYRSAVVVVGYLTFLSSSVGQDFYPRIAAAKAEKQEVSRLVNEQLRLLMLLGSPVLLCAQAFASLLIQLVYSASFQPAAAVLTWQLAGALFMFWSLPFSYAILGRRPQREYFLIEFLAGVMLVFFHYFFVFRLGLVGAGIGYLAAYAGYFGVVLIVASRGLGISIDHDCKLTGLVVIVASGALVAVQTDALFNPTAVLIATVVTFCLALRLYRVTSRGSGAPGIVGDPPIRCS